MDGMEKILQIDSVYTDFAFDFVDHSILTDKLHNQNGICNAMLNWFASYLSNRMQTVVINGYELERCIASSGVPQDSHLGSALFLLFINDIGQQIRHCRYSLFADAMKISRKIETNAEVELMQAD
ncbi:hypothetical protein KGM_202071 [Danaus plexippus plexippus]|uniref:Reverse transcriptase domain-containing protein n=1 Tax=Danaus plexippus plexippus TaxID=278856 RepID=A0A212F820_DANPL|nr:hypothetical protein KGM_202071 [Danaus plexippus plexippus]